MIVSYKYKFIFIKNYKVAGSSIEKALYDYLTPFDIIAQTEDYQGINCFGQFDTNSLKENFSKEIFVKYSTNNFRYFAHMPAWLVKERISSYVYNQFYKFSILRNPWSLFVSHFKWQNNPNNHLGSKKNFDELLADLYNARRTDNIFNFYRLCDKDSDKIIVDKILSFEDIGKELTNFLSDFNINIKNLPLLKQSKLQDNYRDYFNDSSKKIIEKFFEKEIDIMKYKF